ncbi:M23 family metallopeptidase [Melioribacter sp. OK-6-Me]|uniref:M23 family metallopeptidase n=1 Tax=unclassified Melioribacter TaxID=2627329 RepID=UPI003EDA77DC
MNWLNLKKFKKIFFLLTPNIPDSGTKTYKLSLLRASAYVFIYTVVAWFILIFILSVTPIKNFMFVLDNQELKLQREKINELQGKVNLLTSQLEKIASTNEKLKYAVMLANSDSSDSTRILYDSLQKNIKKRIELGGNILKAISLLYYKLSEQDKETGKPIFFFTPVRGVITKKFNPSEGHMGLDLGVKEGTPIYAAAGGLVIFANYTIDYGYTIILQHDDNYISIYKHCSELLKKPQDYVVAGELIALSGNSGTKTTGPHLHFELWFKGKPVDPEQYILIK